VGVRDLQRLAPLVEKNLGCWGVMKVIKRERNQAIALAVRRKWENTEVGDSFEVLHSNLWECSTRWCIGTVHKIYLVLNYLIIEVTLFF